MDTKGERRKRTIAREQPAWKHTNKRRKGRNRQTNEQSYTVHITLVLIYFVCALLITRLVEKKAFRTTLDESIVESCGTGRVISNVARMATEEVDAVD